MMERRTSDTVWWVVAMVAWPVVLMVVALAEGALLAIMGGLPEPQAFVWPAAIGLIAGYVVGGAVGRVAVLRLAPRRLWVVPVVWALGIGIFEVSTDLVFQHVYGALELDLAALTMPVTAAVMIWLAMSSEGKAPRDPG